MGRPEHPNFIGDSDKAMETSPHRSNDTLRLYRDVPGLSLVASHGADVASGVGEGIATAAAHLDARGVTRRDEIQILPECLAGLWISDPADIVHLVDRSVD